MRTVDLPVIRNLELFASMDEAHFAELLQAAYLQRFPPKVQLIREGEQADFLYVVIDGSVELFAQSNRRETTIAIFEPVSTFILAAVLKDAVNLMSARTIEQSRILMIPSENIRSIMEKDGAFARAIVLELAIRYRSVVKDLKHHKLRTAVERLANYLLREHQKQGSRGELTLPIDKRTLASLLGMTPENLSWAFNTLDPYGVHVDGNQIRLTKITDLIILAKPTPLIDDAGS